MFVRGATAMAEADTNMEIAARERGYHGVLESGFVRPLGRVFRDLGSRVWGFGSGLRVLYSLHQGFDCRGFSLGLGMYIEYCAGGVGA